MLLPRVWLWLRWTSKGAPGPFHDPAQVSIDNPPRLWHGVSLLTAGLTCFAMHQEQLLFLAQHGIRTFWTCHLSRLRPTKQEEIQVHM